MFMYAFRGRPAIQARIAILGGLAMVLASLFLTILPSLTAAQPYPNGVTATATVSSVQSHLEVRVRAGSETVCDVTAWYVVDGITYYVSSNPDHPSPGYCAYREGQTISVSYESTNPAVSRLLVKPRTYFIVSILGFLLGAFGVVNGLALRRGKIKAPYSGSLPPPPMHN